ncbi:hypothetical protein PINS_up005944 [Pythium insidiosum]|nr:hypothetical protein PINS_up005944 [Pythium insidiosum]
MTPRDDRHVELAAFGFAPSVLAALYKAGFRYPTDLLDRSVRELSNGITVKDATAVFNAVRETQDRVVSLPPSALDLLAEANRIQPISTLVPVFDDILGGGIAKGELTEICGAPGTAKTQLGIHLCLAAHIQRHSQSLTGALSSYSSIFVDTEGSFVIERVAAMAESLSQRLSGVARDDLLRGIAYYRAHDYVEQLEILHSLPHTLHSQSEIQLIVVDSIAFHFRHGFEDYGQRARALDATAVLLERLATQHNVAVTNRTSFLSRSGLSDVPALGDAWAHTITNRVTLAWEAADRVARVTKSSCLAQGACRFQVTREGIQGLDNE